MRPLGLHREAGPNLPHENVQPYLDDQFDRGSLGASAPRSPMSAATGDACEQLLQFPAMHPCPQVVRADGVMHALPDGRKATKRGLRPKHRNGDLPKRSW